MNKAKIYFMIMVTVFGCQMIILDFFPLTDLQMAGFFASMVGQWVLVVQIARERYPYQFAMIQAEWEADSAPIKMFVKLPYYAFHLLRLATGNV